MHNSNTYPSSDNVFQMTSQCAKCSLTFSTERELSDHKLQHIASYTCDLCDFSCEDEYWLRLHEKVHATSDVQSSVMAGKCSRCSFTTLSKNRMLQHMSAHVGNSPYHCVLCDFRSGNVSNMYRHVRGRHKIFNLDTLKSYVHIGRRDEGVTEAADPTNHRSADVTAPDDKARSCVSELDSKNRSVQMWREHRGGGDARHPVGVNIDSQYGRSEEQRNRGDPAHQRECRQVHSRDKSHTSMESARDLPKHKSMNVKSSSYAEKLAGILNRDVARNGSPVHTNYPMLGKSSQELLTSSTINLQGKAVPLYKCKLCSMKSLEKRLVLEHIEAFHSVNSDLQQPEVNEVKVYYCQLCLHTTNDRVDMRFHYRVHHPNGNMVISTSKPQLKEKLSKKERFTRLFEEYLSISTIYGGAPSELGDELLIQASLDIPSNRSQSPSRQRPPQEPVVSQHRYQTSGRLERERYLHEKALKSDTPASGSSSSASGQHIFPTGEFIDAASIEIVSDSESDYD